MGADVGAPLPRKKVCDRSWQMELRLETNFLRGPASRERHCETDNWTTDHGQLTTDSIMYSPTLLDHFHHPRNVGEIAEASVVVEASNPVCGDLMKLWAVVRDGKNSRCEVQSRGLCAFRGLRFVVDGSDPEQIARGTLRAYSRRGYFRAGRSAARLTSCGGSRRGRPEASTGANSQPDQCGLPTASLKSLLHEPLIAPSSAFGHLQR